MMLVLVMFDEIGQNVTLIALRRANRSLKNIGEPGKRGLIVLFGTNRPHANHLTPPLH